MRATNPCLVVMDMEKEEDKTSHKRMKDGDEDDDATYKLSENTGITILGYNVHFPNGKKPFPPQLAVMSKALYAMDKSKSALLESPTGNYYHDSWLVEYE